jgi:O-antigen/teichoic acid export membrane protein
MAVLGSNLTVTASNVLVSVILSRILGASGYGLYSAILVVPIMVFGITQLGIRRSAIYHFGQKTLPENDVVSALFILWIIASFLSITICGAVYFTSETESNYPLIIGIVLVSIPFLLVNVFAGGVFLGKEQILRANILNTGPALVNLVLAVVLVWFCRLSVLGAFIALSLANIVMFIFVYMIFIREYKYRITWKYHEKTMKSMVKLGIVNALAIFVMQLNYRFDVLMLKKLSTLDQVGIYSLATQIAEQMWHIPYAIETIVMSRSANTANNTGLSRTVTSIFRVSILIGIVACLLIFLLAPIVIPAVFGSEFIGSVSLIRIILPGVLLMVGFRILNSRLIGMGKPQVAIFTFIPALIINIVLNFILIPRYGSTGAAWATNISYGLGTLAFLFAFSWKLKIPVKEILLIRKSDFYFFRDIKLFSRWKNPS